ncbi:MULTISPECIES: histone H1 [unclassified Mesorhizobium]|uniref:histone H1 n=1 Tax=unclassified Mesorhizobium TaxID=325217 RepID=UPI000FCCC1EE|nr:MULTISPECIES: histone H1 [unclassified Mesorhizobium]RUW02278.1 histone H1 [Mesorhizobium sp. M1A.F.Ca.IN.020.04.1.1]RUW15776.1 histone H1 [Mesorhizobium sp. M1A.F.Ca.IN.020.03.1.1]RWF74623.1 MAG: histone H1 [Mesorhizobium sp.]RWG18559.1 MAG: histone H1 [Mesorhizobium sp.]RWG28539.1 MAG: histone H1 [Mesorhizobium sp.]
MTEKHPKRPRDPNQLAKSIVDLATGDAPAEEDSKNKAAVELGRRGGKIGGRVRADRMSAEERADAARLAASARWRKRGD